MIQQTTKIHQSKNGTIVKDGAKVIEAKKFIRISPCDPHHKIGEILFTDSPFFILLFLIPFFAFVSLFVLLGLLACFVSSLLHATLRTKFKGEITKDLYC